LRAATRIDLAPRPLGPHAARVPTPAKYKDYDIDLSRFAWFHGAISKEESELLMASAAKGTFLVRNRSRYAGQFVLVWKVCLLFFFVSSLRA
jgi:hypothetical protein